jgi:hypothetical protein
MSIINKNQAPNYEEEKGKKKAEVGMKNAPKKVDCNGNWNKSDTRTTPRPRPPKVQYAY